MHRTYTGDARSMGRDQSFLLGLNNPLFPGTLEGKFCLADAQQSEQSSGLDGAERFRARADLRAGLANPPARAAGAGG